MFNLYILLYIIVGVFLLKPFVERCFQGVEEFFENRKSSEVDPTNDRIINAYMAVYLEQRKINGEKK